MRKVIPTLILAAFALSGCALAEESNASGLDSPGGPSLAGSDRLYAHDVVGAQTSYAANDDSAGLAITSLLLLPYSDASTRLITQHLGGRDALDAQGDIIWGDQGLAYFVSRGVAWDDSPSTAGIKTLLVDRLPWSRRQLDSVDGFVTGLSQPAGLMSDAVAGLADELGRVSDHVSETLDDPNFVSFFLPGQVFHDVTLDLTLGKPEFAALKAGVEGARTILYFAAAYDHAWTLERAFGESIWLDVIADAEDPDYVEGAEVVDYQVAHLNESLGRAVKTASYLEQAQASAGVALRSVGAMFELGAGQTTMSALDWRSADDAVAQQLAEFFNALADATQDPTDLPYVSPATQADLSLVFESRTVTDDQSLLFVDRYDDGFGIVSEVTVNEDAVAAWTDGVFTPDIEESEFLLEESSGELVETLTDDLFTSFEASASGF